MGKGRLVVRLLGVLVETRVEMGAGRGEMLCPVSEERKSITGLE
jgi:hypothetical protein